MTEKDEESRKRLSMMDAKLSELETLKAQPGKNRYEWKMNQKWMSETVIF